MTNYEPKMDTNFGNLDEQTYNESREIAETIISQIKALSPMALMSYGAKNFSVEKNGCSFQINTPKISNGWVLITLDRGEDLYDLEFFNNRKKWLNVETGVYCDMLVEIIDKNIETEQYQKLIRR